MIQLTKALSAWGMRDFQEVLKQEIKQIDAKFLPLQQGLSQSSYSCDGSHNAIILSVTEEAGFIRVKTGIFYTGIIAGCSCADDPTPIDELTEYCEVQFDIDKLTAETTITLLTDA